MRDIPDAPWIGKSEEDYEDWCNTYSNWEEEADHEAEESDRRWKEI